MLFRSFSRSVRPGELRPSAWDVTLVLQSLTDPPYEPLRTVDECFLASKTLFLLAFASAKCVGELQARRFVSLTPRVGVRHPFVLFRVSWRKRRMPPLTTRSLRGSVYWPYLSRALILIVDSYVRCERSGVTWPALLRIVRDASGCSSPQDISRRRSLRRQFPFGSRR